MEFIYNQIFRRHDTGNHPENANRLNFLKNMPSADLPDGSVYLEFIHDAAYVKHVRDLSEAGGGLLDADTMVGPQSYAAAVAAVSAAVEASRSGGFAMVRPPGHHAYARRGSGFCLFNNIAVAAAMLAREGRRVMILDFDGHCGDGTEDIFYDSPAVLYCTLHQYPAFPYTGTVDQIGYGAGRGFTVNVPLPPESGDDLFWKGMDIIMQVAGQFDPEVVAVSAGFDAHQSDPLLNLRLSTTTYFELGELLTKSFPRVFAVLEGGYHIENLKRCAQNFFNGINGAQPAHKENKTDSLIQVIDECDHRLFELEDKLKEFWKIS